MALSRTAKVLSSAALVVAIISTGIALWLGGRVTLQAPPVGRSTVSDSLLRISQRAHDEARKAKSADRDFLLSALSRALSNAGQLQQALDVATEVSEAARRIAALTSLVRVSLRVKSELKPSLIAQLAVQALRKMNEEGPLRESLDYQWAVADVSSALAETGELASALALARSPRSDALKAEALAAVAAQQVRRHSTSQATAGVVADALSRAQEAKADGGLPDIVAAYGAIGDFPAAIRIAEQIREPYQKVSALLRLAEEQAKTNRNKAAAAATEITAAAKRLSTEHRWVYRDIAILQANLGDERAAMLSAAAIEEPQQRAWALAGIARAQARRGTKSAALDTFRQAVEVGQLVPRPKSKNDFDWRLRVFEEIALAQVDAGYLNEAFETLAAVPGDSPSSHDVVRAIAAAYAKASDVTSARAWAEGQSTPELRAIAFIGMIEGLFGGPEQR